MSRISLYINNIKLAHEFHSIPYTEYRSTKPETQEVLVGIVC
jgi:hypothetical protein